MVASWGGGPEWRSASHEEANADRDRWTVEAIAAKQRQG
jgi:hypothetical protein